MFASAVVCFLLVSGIPLLDLTSKAALKLAFFMLPARAWELLIGGVAAWIMLRRPDLHIPAGVKYSGLVIILATFIWGLSPVHPGPDAVIVTLATATILLGQGDWLRVNALTRAFTKLGDTGLTHSILCTGPYYLLHSSCT
jgi:peptidoglycan/LPS O-acetylase OafA/YrhL